jgi:hypothetical protein
MERARREMGPDALLLELARSAAGSAPPGRLRGGLRQPRIDSPSPAEGFDTEGCCWRPPTEISANFAVSPEIGRITALVGPPGCGKTTTLVKLAITQGLKPEDVQYA